jgi:PII-like signaling protein|tara:strand:+ start:744 stop:1250 length:507 start_codon:yes stop_codon:yes gene_type:complete
MIRIKIGGPQATVELNARKALDGSLLIMDHKKIDIAVIPEKMKVVTFPKTTATEDVYDYQNRLLELLADKGVIDRSTIQGGHVFRSLEAVVFSNEQINSLQAAVYVIAEFIDHEANIDRVADEYEKELEDMYTHPDDQDSTEFGEVPQYAEKGAMRPGYYYYPLRYRY